MGSRTPHTPYYYLHAGVENDVIGLQALEPELLAVSGLYADAGFEPFCKDIVG